MKLLKLVPIYIYILVFFLKKKLGGNPRIPPFLRETTKFAAI